MKEIFLVTQLSVLIIVQYLNLCDTCTIDDFFEENDENISVSININYFFAVFIIFNFTLANELFVYMPEINFVY